MSGIESIGSNGDCHRVNEDAGANKSMINGDNDSSLNDSCGSQEIKKQNGVEQEVSASDQREDSYLTEEDIFQMKILTAQSGTTSEAMRSVMSLADTTSSFEDRGLNDETDESDALNADDSKDTRDGETDSEYCFPDQCTISKGFAFNRRRPSNIYLPSTVTVLKYPFAKKSEDSTDQQSEVDNALAEACVYLVGTAHFSRKSQMDVLRTIREVQPDFVMVELCPSRVSLLSMDEKTLLRETKQPTMEKLINIIKESGVIRGVLYILLLSMTAHVTKQLDVAPGGEMRAAYTGAQKVPQCRIVLGDRPVHITIQRAVGSLNFFQKIRFLYSLITSLNTKITSEDVERCKKADILEAFLDGVSEKFPPLSRILVDERDLYMVNTLQKVLRSSTLDKLDACKAINAKYQPVKAVAVVGIGHVRGMVSKWGKRTSTAELLKIPEPSRAFKIIKYGFKGLIISLMVYGTYRCGSRIYNKIFAQK